MKKYIQLYFFFVIRNIKQTNQSSVPSIFENETSTTLFITSSLKICIVSFGQNELPSFGARGKAYKNQRLNKKNVNSIILLLIKYKQ